MSNTTICSLGIGSGASSELVTRIAEAGRGVSDMIQNEQILSATVIKQLKISKRTRFTEFRLLCFDQYNTQMNIPLLMGEKSVFEDDIVNLYCQIPDNMSLNNNARLVTPCGGLDMLLNLSDTVHLCSHIHHKVFYNIFVKEQDLTTSLVYNILNSKTAFVVVGEQQDTLDSA